MEADHEFEREDFDAFEFVEELLRMTNAQEQPSNANESAGIPQLVQFLPQFALQSQQLTKAIHQTLQQIGLSLPLVQMQLGSFEKAIGPLKKQIDTISRQIHASPSSEPPQETPSDQVKHHDDNTHEFTKEDLQERQLRQLMVLHEAKLRLKSCSSALVEAAKWEKNVRMCRWFQSEGTNQQQHPRPQQDAEQIDMKALAQQVCEMQHSLQVLQEMPGTEEREKTLDNLCNQIELNCKPKLLELLQEESFQVHRLQECLGLYRSIHKQRVVQVEFARCRLAQVHRFWLTYSSASSTLNENAPNDSGAVSFNGWLATFYEEVIRTLQKEIPHAKEIFAPNELLFVVRQMLRNAFGTLTDGFHTRLEEHFSLQTLQVCFEATCEFGSQVARMLESIVRTAASTPTPAAPTTAVSSMQLTVGSNTASSLTQATSGDLALELIEILFEPFETFINKYQVFATRAITSELNRIQTRLCAKDPEPSDDDDAVGMDMDTSGSFVERFAENLEESSRKICAILENQVSLCHAITNGAALPAMADAVSSSLETFWTNMISQSVPVMRQECKLAQSVGPTDGGEADGLILNNVVVVPDWNHFHAALTLLKANGRVKRDFSGWKSRTRVQMVEQIAPWVSSVESLASGRMRSVSSASTSSNSAFSYSSTAQLFLLQDLSDGSQVANCFAKKWLLQDQKKRLHALESFAHDRLRASTNLDRLFPAGDIALGAWSTQVQLLTYDSVLVPIVRILEPVSTREVWTKQQHELKDELPSMSMLPQDYITSVADLLLSLLPQLEPFAESSDLTNAFIASEGANQVCAQEWRKLQRKTMLQLSSEEMEACQRMFELEDDQDADVHEGAERDQVQDQEQGESAVDLQVSATRFVDLWTSVVANGTMAALLNMICSITSLSPLGAKQLVADLSYFQNVLNALGGASDKNFVVQNLLQVLPMETAEHQEFVEKTLVVHDSIADPIESSSNVNGEAVQRRVLAKLNKRLLEQRHLCASTLGNSSYY